MLKSRRLSLMIGWLALCALLTGCTGGVGSHPRAWTSSAGSKPSASVPKEQASSNGIEQTNYETDNPPPLQRPSTSIKVSEPEEVPAPPGTSAQRNSPQGPAISSPSSAEPFVTIHADDLEVKRVLEMLSREAKTSIVVSAGVTGKITMDIQNRNWSDALVRGGRPGNSR